MIPITNRNLNLFLKKLEHWKNILKICVALRTNIYIKENDFKLKHDCGSGLGLNDESDLKLLLVG